MEHNKRWISWDKIRGFVGKEDPVILEIGCNDGSDSLNFLREFPGVRLHCFEPDPRPIAKFKSRIHDPRCTLYEIAISDHDGFATLHMSGGTFENAPKEDWDYSSSINRPTGHLETFTWCTFERQTEVPTLRLDHWLAGHPEIVEIDFIWADVQGAEHQLIAGGVEALARTRYFYTEYYDRPMYEGQISQREILRRLPAFAPVATYEGCNILLRNKVLVPGRLGRIWQRVRKICGSA